MSDEISSPLLSLIREHGLIDDLQYEEVAGEIKRSGATAVQVLQDFGIMKLDDILHVEATALGTEVISLKDREIPEEALKLVPAKLAQMYHCLPLAMAHNMLQVVLAEPLDPNNVELQLLLGDAGRLRQVLQQEAEEDMVEVFFAKRQVEQVRRVELDIMVTSRRDPRTGLFERGGRDVHGHNPRPRVSRGEMNRLGPGAAAALQHQAPRRIHRVVVQQFAQRVGLVGQTIRLAGGVAVNVLNLIHGAQPA